MKEEQTIENLVDKTGVQLAIEDCFRLGTYDSAKERRILVTSLSIWDAKICLSKTIGSKLHGRTKI